MINVLKWEDRPSSCKKKYNPLTTPSVVNQKCPNIYDRGGQEEEDCLQPIVVTLPGCVVSKGGYNRGRERRGFPGDAES